MNEIRVESVYGFERIVAAVLNGNINQAFELSAILAGELDLPNPYLSYQRFSFAKDQIYGSGSPAVRMAALANLKIKPTMTNTDRILTYYRLQYETFTDLFSFMFDAARRIEENFGVSITQLMTGEVLQPIIVSLSAVTTPPEQTSPAVFLATMLYLVSILTGEAKEDAQEALRYAFEVEAYNELVKHGSAVRRPYFQYKAFLYNIMFNEKSKKAREKLAPAIRSLESYSGEKTIRYFYPRMQSYIPFFIVDKNAWYSGTPQQSGSVALYKPDFPHTATEGKPLLAGIYSSTGSGKTTLLNSLTYYAWLHGNFIVRLEIDMRDAMAAQLMALPLNPNHPAYPTLRAQGLEPMGIGINNVISLLVVEKRSDIDLVPSKPTAVDRLLFVENLDAFHLPWERIAAPKRIFALRFTGDIRTSARVFRTVIESFRLWRMKNKSIPTFMGIDEAYTGASSMPSYTYARALGMAAESSTNLMMTARGLGIALYIATQRPKMIVAGVRTQVSHIFAADVGEEKDMDVILSRIPKSSKDREAVESLFQRSEIRSDPYHWFVWVNLLNGQINVIRSAIAPTALEMPSKSSWDQFNDAKFALESWNEVPTLFKDIGTESNPMPIYEPFLPEKERKKRGTTVRPKTPASAEPEEQKEEEDQNGEEGQNENDEFFFKF